MLAEDFLGGPAVVIMLAREVNHLVPCPVDAAFPSASSPDGDNERSCSCGSSRFGHGSLLFWDAWPG